MPLSVAVADPMTRDFERVGERGREETPGSSPTFEHNHLLCIRLRIERAHGGADVVDRDDVRAPRDGGGDDGRVLGVGLEGDDEVVCGDMCG